MVITRRQALFSFAVPAFFQYEESPGEVPWVPSDDRKIDIMLSLGKVTASDVVYDLGCGDGRVVIAAAKKIGARGVGIDIDPKRIAEANDAAREAALTHLVQFRNQDIFQADFSEATVVMLYMYRSVNLRLKPRLFSELKPGSRIVCNQYGLGDLKPDKQWKRGREKVMLWYVPPRP
jgi:ubiquinone/menaquinone biosynthesis C-methylase UbiE